MHLTYAPTPQVLSINNNLLEYVPSEVGWLSLSKLELSGNDNLRMPKTIIERGFR